MNQATLVEKLLTDPYVKAYATATMSAHAARQSEAPAVRSAAQVLGERGFLALALATGEMVMPPELEPKREELARSLLGGVPFLWVNDLASAAREMELPRHSVAPDACPHEVMWWTFEGSQPFRLAIPGGSSSAMMRMEAMVIINTADAILAHAIVQTTGSGTAAYIPLARIKHRDVYPKEHNEAGTQVLAMLAFMQSPSLAEIRPLSTPRAERRRLPKTPEDVQFVTLRSREYHRESGDTEAHGDEKGYNIRWIVRGHMRAQWYPTLEAHRLIWIAPYVKGPDSAPLKQTLYKVTR